MNKSSSLLNELYISHPQSTHFPSLRKLWKNTFGDTDTFLDTFFETAFSPKRALCARINNTVVGALYWFDCECSGQKLAYIYAVATAKEFRGKGICHTLMEHTHKCLNEAGYDGAILSPAETSLFDFYGKMGYKTCAYTKEFHYTNDTNLSQEAHLKAASFENGALGEEIPSCANSDFIIRKISKEEFSKLRRSFLPSNAILQENENLDFLETQADFYTGNNFLLTAQIIESNIENTNPIVSSPIQRHLHGIEFLGDISKIPSILRILKCSSGNFRTIGNEHAIGMYYGFTNSKLIPSYIGFIFD